MVAKSPRIGVGPGFDSQGCVTCICLCEKFLWIVTGIPFGQKGRAPCLAPFELPQSFLQWPNSHCCQPSALEQPIGWSWLKLKRVRRMKLHHLAPPGHLWQARPFNGHKLHMADFCILPLELPVMFHHKTTKGLFFAETAYLVGLLSLKV